MHPQHLHLNKSKLNIPSAHIALQSFWPKVGQSLPTKPGEKNVTLSVLSWLPNLNRHGLRRQVMISARGRLKKKIKTPKKQQVWKHVRLMLPVLLSIKVRRRMVNSCCNAFPPILLCDIMIWPWQQENRWEITFVFVLRHRPWNLTSSSAAFMRKILIRILKRFSLKSDKCSIMTKKPMLHYSYLLNTNGSVNHFEIVCLNICRPPKILHGSKQEVQGKGIRGCSPPISQILSI